MPKQEVEAGEADEAEEVLDVVLPSGNEAAEVVHSKITPVLSPRNGNCPVAISYSTAPNENKSVRASSSLHLICSGDMYAMVPTAVPSQAPFHQNFLELRLGMLTRSHKYGSMAE
jgi:hypothetical protein